ncbi:hypothetical protein VNI00_010313 [Paramarasmius palmivorus]|uniref:PROP1-like PPR domain-containing protein n=1 Tax=Paramarasmius palmivorus TaxID=297713 RepID=A0AAW0CIN8_9AGAR
MLPKVATTILHSTGRAAAAVHTQSTIRNVLHPHSTTSSTGHGYFNSNNSSNGRGGRFTHGYHGASRAVTQANPSLAVDDGSFVQLDEQEQPHKTPSASSSRRPSFHRLSQATRLTVLRSVQRIHSRSFTTPATDDSLPPQKTLPPPPPTKPSLYTDLQSLSTSTDTEHISQVIFAFLSHLSSQSPIPPSPEHFEYALTALQRTRQPGEPLTLFLTLYHSLLSFNLAPTPKTCVTLLDVLTTRSNELQFSLGDIVAKEFWEDSIAFYIPPKGSPYAESRSRRSVARSKRKADLEKEVYGILPIALRVYNTLLALSSPVPESLLVSLLEVCALHADVQSALQVYKSLPDTLSATSLASIHVSLLNTLSRAGMWSDCRSLFESYTSDATLLGKTPYTEKVKVYNEMIAASFRCGHPDTAVSILHDMLSPSSPIKPASSTYTHIIAGFSIGDSPSIQLMPPRITSLEPKEGKTDLDSALTWFNKLLSQPTPPHASPFEPSDEPTRPEPTSWKLILNSLSSTHLEAGNDLWVRLLDLAPVDGIPVRSIDRIRLVERNLSALDTLSPAEQLDKLSFLREHVIQTLGAGPCRGIWEAYLRLGHVDQAVEFGVSLFEKGKETERGRELYFMQLALAAFEGDRVMSLENLWRLLNVATDMGIKLTRFDSVKSGVVRAYFAEQAKDKLTLEQWWTVLSFATDMPSSPVLQILGDVPPHVKWEDVPKELADAIVGRVELDGQDIKAMADGNMKQGLLEVFGQGEVESVAESVSAESAEEVSTAPTSPLIDTTQPQDDLPPSLRIDRTFTRQLDEFISKRLTLNITRTATDTLYNTFTRTLLSRAIAPSPYTLSKLASVFARANQLDRVMHVYAIAQRVLEGLSSDAKAQSESWVVIENGMCVAFTALGDMDKANIHRLRLLERGTAPSADAYAGLILGVKDTTDDTSASMALFREALERGVKPNLYLYNNIISKLSKARKASAALELFHSMRVQSSPVHPSAITYGAVIGACARVGDVTSAEVLFKEMVASSLAGYSRGRGALRVPPFNTMMQVYVSTKPDREKALWYFEEMGRCGVRPTEHAYKLLMEAYALEPIDLPALLRTFAQLQQTPETFASILATPQILDALVFEALINVLVAHRRMDLVPEYVAMMNEKGVHMTACVCNGLIRRYASVGEIDKAREVFEGMVDPEVGRAGRWNHAQRAEAEQVEGVAPIAPIHREPSTWEAMVRAELGSGERERAARLVQRMEGRGYPEAVVNRVKGIMVDWSQVLV